MTAKRRRGGDDAVLEGEDAGRLALREVEERAHLAAVALVGAVQATVRLLAGDDGIERLEVVDGPDAALAEHLHALFGKRGVPVGRVGDRGDGAVGEAQCDGERVAQRQRHVGARGEGVHAGRHRAREVDGEVDEVAELADDPSASLLQALRPVRPRNSSCVDAADDRGRTGAVDQRSLHLERQRREAPVEADHEVGRRPAPRLDHRGELVAGDAQRLLDEDGLAGSRAQRSTGPRAGRGARR